MVNHLNVSRRQGQRRQGKAINCNSTIMKDVCLRVKGAPACLS